MQDKIQYTTLAKLPDYYDRYIELIEKAFEYTRPWSFEIDFQPLISPLNFDHCHMIVKDGDIIATTAARKRTFGFQNFSVPSILFGGIAVAENYRGSGIFSDFFEYLLSHYKKVGLFFLWSDLTQLYKKFGFYECGAFIQSGGQKFLEKGLPYAELSRQDQSSIRNLTKEKIEKRYLSFKRDSPYWEEISKVTSVHFHLHRDDRQKVIGYFVSGKGQDLQGIIHEFAFQDERHETLWLEEYSKYSIWLPGNYNQIFNRKNFFFSAFTKIGNTDVFRKFIQNLTGQKILIENIDVQNISFSFSRNAFTLSHDQFLKGLFGPNKIKDFEGLVPEIYIPGLDSI